MRTHLTQLVSLRHCLGALSKPSALSYLVDNYDEFHTACCSLLKDVGLTSGFVGCIESLQVNSSQTSVTFDLGDDSSHDVLHRVNTGSLLSRLFIYFYPETGI